MEKVDISPSKDTEYVVNINMTITLGKACALVNALNEYSKKSHVADDLKNMVLKSAQTSFPAIIPIEPRR